MTLFYVLCLLLSSYLVKYMFFYIDICLTESLFAGQMQVRRQVSLVCPRSDFPRGLEAGLLGGPRARNDTWLAR